jgi:pimeloyl-ACP methyl ester carboxylesterase
MKTFVASDGLQLAYDVTDFTNPWEQPETVVLLHAAMGSSERWFQWVPRLCRSYRVVCLDLRGHGRSQIPRHDQPLTLAQLVDDVRTLFDAVGIVQAHVVGNSAGGYVAQQLAIHCPDRVKTLALFAATPGLKRSHALQWVPRFKEVGLRQFMLDTISERFDAHADVKLVQWFVDQAGSNDPEFIARFVLHMCTHDFMDELSGIRCPTLIVAAGREPIGHAGIYEEMHQRVAKAELMYYDTAGHNICDGYATRCADDLLAFLQRQRTSAMHG